MKTPFKQHQRDQMTNNPNNYKWGIFYFNPRDSRIFVPKRNQWMGWTVNFANPFSYFVIIGFILLVYLLGKLK